MGRPRVGTAAPPMPAGGHLHPEGTDDPCPLADDKTPPDDEPCSMQAPEGRSPDNEPCPMETLDERGGISLYASPLADDDRHCFVENTSKASSALPCLQHGSFPSPLLSDGPTGCISEQPCTVADDQTHTLAVDNSRAQPMRECSVVSDHPVAERVIARAEGADSGSRPSHAAASCILPEEHGTPEVPTLRRPMCMQDTWADSARISRPPTIVALGSFPDDSSSRPVGPPRDGVQGPVSRGLRACTREYLPRRHVEVMHSLDAVQINADRAETILPSQPGGGAQVPVTFARDRDRQPPANDYDRLRRLIAPLKVENVNLSRNLRWATSQINEVMRAIRLLFAYPHRRQWLLEQKADPELCAFFRSIIMWYRCITDEKNPALAFYKRVWEYERGDDCSQTESWVAQAASAAAAAAPNADAAAGAPPAVSKKRKGGGSEDSDRFSGAGSPARHLTSSLLYDACKERSENVRLRAEINKLNEENDELHRVNGDLVFKLRRVSAPCTTPSSGRSVASTADVAGGCNARRGGSERLKTQQPPRPPLPEVITATPRCPGVQAQTLGELASADPKWKKLLDDPDGLFASSDVIDETYSSFLNEMLSLMDKYQCNFKHGIELMSELSPPQEFQGRDTNLGSHCPHGPQGPLYPRKAEENTRFEAHVDAFRKVDATGGEDAPLPPTMHEWREMTDCSDVNIWTSTGPAVITSEPALGVDFDALKLVREIARTRQRSLSFGDTFSASADNSPRHPNIAVAADAAAGDEVSWPAIHPECSDRLLPSHGGPGWTLKARATGMRHMPDAAVNSFVRDKLASKQQGSWMRSRSMDA